MKVLIFAFALCACSSAVAAPITLRCEFEEAKDNSGKVLELKKDPPTQTITIDGEKYYIFENPARGDLKKVTDHEYVIVDETNSLGDAWIATKMWINRDTGLLTESIFGTAGDRIMQNMIMTFPCTKVALKPIPPPPF